MTIQIKGAHVRYFLTGEKTTTTQLISLERLWEQSVQRDDEFSDSEDEGEGGRRHVQDYGDADERNSSHLNQWLAKMPGKSQASAGL